MIKHFRIILILLAILVFIGARIVFAQVNPDLINALNQVLIWNIRLMQQCEAHSEQFDISIPYNQVISEEQQTIKELTDLIDSFGADIPDKRLEVEKSSRDYQALNLDANTQIIIICMYDDLLSKFGHPKVQAFAIKGKNQAYIHYMLLSNAAQQIIGANMVKDIAKIK
jgi:hypothetical protein